MMEIREITQCDEALVEALGRLMPQLSAAARLVRERIERVAADERSRLLVAYGEGRAVGMLTVVWYAAPAGTRGWIEDVVVDAAYRQRGVGRALVRRAVEEARRAGVDTLTLTSRPSRTAARALYLSEGFEPCETGVFRMTMNK